MKAVILSKDNQGIIDLENKMFATVISINTTETDCNFIFEDAEEKLFDFVYIKEQLAEGSDTLTKMILLPITCSSIEFIDGKPTFWSADTNSTNGSYMLDESSENLYYFPAKDMPLEHLANKVIPINIPFSTQNSNTYQKNKLNTNS